MTVTVQVLVDADNVAPGRLRPVLDVLAELAVDLSLTASGRQQALDAMTWPDSAQLLVHAGWQRADLALAESYRISAEPLILVSGDGDFGLLAQQHPGPVLVISGAASGRLRDGAMVVDPATDGLGPVRDWLRTHADVD